MVLIVFGAIFLLVTLVAGKYMMKVPENPSCSENIESVKNNKRNYKVLLIVSSVMIAVGLILELFVL